MHSAHVFDINYNKNTVNFDSIAPDRRTGGHGNPVSASLLNQVELLKRQLRDAEARIQELSSLADQDPLLGLMNRRAFIRETTRTLAEVARYGLEAHLAYIDLNGLKPVNDTYGHAAGDALLGHLGNVLEEMIRDSDTLGRLGGDEFGILLPHTSMTTARLAMARLSDGVEARPLDWKGEKLPVSFSWGVFGLTPEKTAEEVLQAADEEMYHHKMAMKRRAG